MTSCTLASDKLDKFVDKLDPIDPAQAAPLAPLDAAEIPALAGYSSKGPILHTPAELAAKLMWMTAFVIQVQTVEATLRKTLQATVAALGATGFELGEILTGRWSLKETGACGTTMKATMTDPLTGLSFGVAVTAGCNTAVESAGEVWLVSDILDSVSGTARKICSTYFVSSDALPHLNRCEDVDAAIKETVNRVLAGVTDDDLQRGTRWLANEVSVLMGH